MTEPAPLFTKPSGAVVWEGGIQVLGPTVLIPGRTIHVEDLHQARAHAAAVLAACDLVEARCR